MTRAFLAVSAAFCSLSSTATAAEEPAAASPTTELSPRGYPVLPYAENSQPPSDLVWAEESAPPPELEWSTAALEGPALESTGRESPPPPQEAALDRQSMLENEKKAPGSYEHSPQRFAFEIKFGPYSPDVDRYWTGDGPGHYETIFGETNSQGVAIDSPRKRMMSAMAFEWQFYNLGGPFLVGTQIGYFRDKAHALLANTDSSMDSIRSEADVTRFHVMPVSLQLGYRFELLADQYKIPIVPYFKGGLAYGFWWSTDGSKNTSINSRGERGRGGTWGWQINAGAMLRLDVFDVNNSIDLDRTTNINHAYIFGEFQLNRLDDFGTQRGFSVGDATWLLGMAIEM